MGQSRYSRSKLTLLLLLIIAFSLHSVTAIPSNPNNFCISENDDSFVNRCFRQVPENYLSIVADFTQQWINPRSLVMFAVVILVVLPILQLSNVRTSHLTPVLRKFVQNKISIVNFIHRICYTLVLDVALYAIFRQYRPCKCTTDGGATFAHWGSLYGMPSGDAMSGGLFGAFLFDYGPFHPVLGRVAGILIVPLICIERVVLGYHTVAQTTVGAALGIALHYYSTRMPQFLIFFDAIFQIVLGAITLQIDPALSYGYKDTNNLFAWYMWGVSFQVFAVLMIARFYFKKSQIRKLRQSLYSIENTKDVIESTDEIYVVLDAGSTKDRHTNHHLDILRLSDSLYTFAALAVMLIINLISYIITQEAWLVKLRS